MASRGGRLVQPDSQGQYVRQLGWKDSVSGSRVQHKFRLETDQREAEQRDNRLRQLWDQIAKERGAGAREARWDDLTLEIARQVARGAERIELAPENDDETPVSYSCRLQQIQNRFAFLRFVPTDLERYTIGLGAAAIDLRDILLVGDSREDY